MNISNDADIAGWLNKHQEKYIGLLKQSFLVPNLRCLHFSPFLYF